MNAPDKVTCLRGVKLILKGGKAWQKKKHERKHYVDDLENKISSNS